MPEKELKEIHKLVISGLMNEGERRLRVLLDSMDLRDLKAFKPTIESIIALFFPKRRRALSRALNSRLTQVPETNVSTITSIQDTHTFPQSKSNKKLPSETRQNTFSNHVQSGLDNEPKGSMTGQLQPSIDLANVKKTEMTGGNPAVNIAAEFKAKLVQLSTQHMFEWRTFYREAITEMFDRVENAIRDSTHEADICSTVTVAFSRHANEIFGRGFTHLTQNRSFPQIDAINKELNGLQSFLELPLEYYSLRAPNATTSTEAHAIRATCSAILTGILTGFSQTDFEETKGWKILPQNQRRWIHALGFLTAKDLDRIESLLAASPVRDGIRDCLAPVVRALDDVLAEHHESAYLPGLVQYNSQLWRFELFLLLPPSVESKRYLEIHCYLKQSHVSQGELLESANRGVGLIAAQLRKDLQDWVNAHELVRTLVINTASGSAEQSALSAFEILSFELAKYAKGRDVQAALKYNFARDFPLHNPALQSYFHVHRTSVRNLLRAFDTRNGIRLWCSVRRSGKTTASSDLGATTGTSCVVTQTCDNTDQNPEPGRFYKAFVGALELGRHIPASFFADNVAACVKERGSLDSKIVFVLDEYETLFGNMAAAIKRDRGLRYTVVQPLLDQMVAFSQQNLLVFIGQRPDAHFIIMDQNQLSPYVEQDAFPLFEHVAGATNSEFRNLLNKVLSNRTSFEDAFADAIYAETGGHPWLTVKLLVDFFDWLILQNRSARELHFTKADFDSFSINRLTTEWIAVCNEYVLFRNYISEMLSEYGQNWEPWLYAVYATMRMIVLENPSQMECSLADFTNIIEKLRLPQEFGYQHNDLLTTAVRSNFLALNGDRIRPRIPLMARISVATHPRIAW